MTNNKKKNEIKCFEVSVSAGKFKGKKILIPNIKTTRSSKSIIRESLFNTLQFDIIGKNFVEVFAGSGSVGIEALSRGAKEAFFIELNPAVFDILKGNIATLNNVKATTIKGDSFEKFPILLQSLSRSDVSTYFYFDPPFSIREGMEEVYHKTIRLIESIDPVICEKIIVEHMSKIALPTNIGIYILQKKRKFGKSTLSYYTAG